jgi:hypothetical protein
LFETIGLERKQKTINSFGQLLAADQERRRLEDKAKHDQEQRGAST